MSLILVAEDSFMTSSDQSLTTYSSSWTYNSGANFTVLDASDDVKCNVASDVCAHWNESAFKNNQYSQIAISYITPSAAPGFIGPAVRCASSENTCYGMQVSNHSDGTDGHFFKLVNNTWTSLADSVERGFLVTSIVRIEAVGTMIVPKINGTLYTYFMGVTDTSIASGYAGITGSGTDGSTRGDTWKSGNMPNTPSESSVLDDFNRSDGPLGSNWSTIHDGYAWSISGSKALANQTNAIEYGNYWNPTTYGADTEVGFYLSQVPGATNSWFGCGVRIANPDSSKNGYVFKFRNDVALGYSLNRIDNESETTLVSNDFDFIAGISVAFQAIETYLFGWVKDGATWYCIANAEDTTYQDAGYLLINGFNAGSAEQTSVDNFFGRTYVEGGDDVNVNYNSSDKSKWVRGVRIY